LEDTRVFYTNVRDVEGKIPTGDDADAPRPDEPAGGRSVGLYCRRPDLFVSTKVLYPVGALGMGMANYVELASSRYTK